MKFVDREDQLKVLEETCSSGRALISRVKCDIE